MIIIYVSIISYLEPFQFDFSHSIHVLFFAMAMADINGPWIKLPGVSEFKYAFRMTILNILTFMNSIL